MSKLKKIAPNNNTNAVNQKAMLDYLQGKLPADERHELEKQMVDNAFLNDAVEGLEQLSNNDIMQYVDELNANLQKQTQKKKLRKLKRKLKQQDWILISAVIILSLCIIGYVVIKIMQKSSAQ